MARRPDAKRLTSQHYEPVSNGIIYVTVRFGQVREYLDDRGRSVFRRGLLVEATNCLLGGEVAVAKSLLRDYINATIGFETLADRIEKNPKSLHQLLGPRGNPSLKNLTRILTSLQESEMIRLEVTAKRNKIKENRRAA